MIQALAYTAGPIDPTRYGKKFARVLGASGVIGRGVGSP
jgi:hypothetical protein